MNKLVLHLIGLAGVLSACTPSKVVLDQHGALIRSDTTSRTIYLCFTGHDYYDGFTHVLEVLDKENVTASFFLTGDFVRAQKALVQSITSKGHYVGAHSDRHLLYCDWGNRDSLLHAPAVIKQDIANNVAELKALGIESRYFMPPYEWYNKEVVAIAASLDQITVNFSPGTRSNADYTTPDMKNYLSSASILKGIYDFEASEGMNGFHLLIHPGVHALRTDKLYIHLEALIQHFRQKGYAFEGF